MTSFEVRYAAELLNKHNMLDYKYEPTPMNLNEKLQIEDGADKANPTTYRNIMGGLMYLTHSRPDVAFSVSYVSRFMQSPSRIHMGAVEGY